MQGRMLNFYHQTTITPLSLQFFKLKDLVAKQHPIRKHAGSIYSQNVVKKKQLMEL